MGDKSVFVCVEAVVVGSWHGDAPVSDFDDEWAMSGGRGRGMTLQADG